MAKDIAGVAPEGNMELVELQILLQVHAKKYSCVKKCCSLFLIEKNNFKNSLEFKSGLHLLVALCFLTETGEIPQLNMYI